MSRVLEERAAQVVVVAENPKTKRWYTEAVREETDTQKESRTDRLTGTEEEVV